MNKLMSIIRANWAAIALALSLAVDFGTSRANQNQMRDEIDLIEATQPAVMRDELTTAMKDVSSIKTDVAQTRVDVAYIRGQIDRHR